MDHVRKPINDSDTLAGSVRVLTGSTYSGKRAIYISGTPDGLRFLAEVLLNQAESPNQGFSKMKRETGELFFTTGDSVDTFEVHCTEEFPIQHIHHLPELD